MATKAGRCPPEDVCKIGIELCEGGVVLPLQGERGIGEPWGREMDLRAVVQHLSAVDEPWKPWRGGQSQRDDAPVEVVADYPPPVQPCPA